MWRLITMFWLSEGAEGTTAGMYAARYGLSVGVVERMMGGASIINVEKVENYPGFLEGITGPDLGAVTQEQAMTAGAEFVMGEVSGISEQGDYRIVDSDAGEFPAKSVIIAAGSRLRLLGIPGEEESSARIRYPLFRFAQNAVSGLRLPHGVAGVEIRMRLPCR